MRHYSRLKSMTTFPSTPSLTIIVQQTRDLEQVRASSSPRMDASCKVLIQKRETPIISWKTLYLSNKVKVKAILPSKALKLFVAKVKQPGRRVVELYQVIDF